MKNTLNGNNNRLDVLDVAKEWISNLEDKLLEFTQSEQKNF